MFGSKGGCQRHSPFFCETKEKGGTYMVKNSIWIAGAGGRIGGRLVEALNADVSNKIIATDKEEVDVTKMEEVIQACDCYRPTVIINCASLSDAEYCEAHETEAYRVNALGARNLAAVSRQHNAKIIYLSSDDVFCGNHNRAKNEFDIPTPETVYGKSKLAGENFTRDLNLKHLIIRSSWVYGAGGNDFLGTVLDKAKKGESFEAPLDRLGTPTCVDSLVQFIAKMVNNQEYGIYHAADQGVATRHQFATRILSLFGYDASLAVATFAKKDGAVVSTALDDLMMRMTGIHTMPAWEKDLEAYVDAHKSRKEN